MFRRRAFTHQFTSRVQLLDFGGMAYHVAYLPNNLVNQLPLKEHPRLRIDAMVEDVPHHGALQPSQRRHYILLSKRLLKEVGKSLGETVTISFDVADQDAVDVPPELELALAHRPHLLKRWNELTPGKQRSLAYRVAQAKRSETRESRVDEVLSLISDGLD
ncbi:MAG: YdeI/OmpD-associated family protein [Verrucomicrobiota bacterium]